MNSSHFDKLFNEFEDTQQINSHECIYCNSTNFFTYNNTIVCSNCNSIIKEDFVDIDANIEDYSSNVSELAIDTSTKLKISGRGRKYLKKLNNSAVNVYKEKIIAEAKKRFEDVVERYEMWKYAINNNLIDPSSCTVLPQKDTLKTITNLNINLKQFEDLINSATIIFKIIKPYIISREPKKTAIIAYCFYYANKENYTIFTNSELMFLFGITSKTLTLANNRINRTLKQHPELRQSFNRRPVNVHDAISILKRRILLTQEQINIIETTINRLSNISSIIKNDAQIIVAGVLGACYKKRNEFKNISITEDDILDILDISITSFRKATKQMLSFVYQPVTSLLL